MSIFKQFQFTLLLQCDFLKPCRNLKYVVVNDYMLRRLPCEAVQKEAAFAGLAFFFLSQISPQTQKRDMVLKTSFSYYYFLFLFFLFCCLCPCVKISFFTLTNYNAQCVNKCSNFPFSNKISGVFALCVSFGKVSPHFLS